MDSHGPAPPQNPEESQRSSSRAVHPSEPVYSAATEFVYSEVSEATPRDALEPEVHSTVDGNSQFKPNK